MQLRNFKKNNLGQAIKLLFLLDLLNKGALFLRQYIISYFYKFSAITDAFNFTFGSIGMALNLFTEALIVGIIPFLKEKKEDNDKLKFIFSLSITMLLFFFITGILLLFFFNPLMSIMAPGFSSMTLNYVYQFFIFYLFYAFFQTISRIFESYFREQKVFGIISTTTVISTIISLVILIMLGKSYHLAVVIGMVVGMIVSFGMLTVIIPKPKEFSFDSSVFTLVKFSVPLILSSGIGVINTIVDRAFATNLETGVLTVLTYSSMFVTLMLSLLTSAVSSASYSYISHDIHQKDFNAVQNTISKIKKSYILISYLVLLLFISLGNPVLTLLFEMINIKKSYIDLMFVLTLLFLPMLLFNSIGSLTVQVYYSFKDTKIVTVTNILCILGNILLNLIFFKYFGVYVLAISTIMSSLIATLITGLRLNKKHEISVINSKDVISFGVYLVLCILIAL